MMSGIELGSLRSRYLRDDQYVAREEKCWGDVNQCFTATGGEGKGDDEEVSEQQVTRLWMMPPRTRGRCHN